LKVLFIFKPESLILTKQVQMYGIALHILVRRGV